ncbi:hypothetical protein LA080_002616 [Diaporthe eres]|nr:hypothetical protein LA080_002616 [Diaporthe eres]
MQVQARALAQVQVPGLRSQVGLGRADVTQVLCPVAIGYRFAGVLPGHPAAPIFAPRALTSTLLPPSLARYCRSQSTGSVKSRTKVGKHLGTVYSGTCRFRVVSHPGSGVPPCQSCFTSALLALLARGAGCECRMGGAPLCSRRYVEALLSSGA